MSPRQLTVRAEPPAESEDSLRQKVETFAKHTLGWRAFHTPNCKTRSGRYSSGGATGWPDTVFLRSPRIVFVEFKGAGRVEISTEQMAVLNELRLAGHETFLWRVGQVSLQEIANYLRPGDRERAPELWTDPLVVGPWTFELLRAAKFRIVDRNRQEVLP